MIARLTYKETGSNNGIMKQRYGLSPQALIGVLCMAVYFTSYLTRMNFSVTVSETASAEGFLKSQLGTVTTFGFVSYGVGQLVSGYLSDAFNCRRIVFLGLAATSVFNAVLPFCSSIALMSAVWCLNGFAQAMLWPPLVRIMTEYLPPERFSGTCALVTVAGSAGTVLIYLVAPLCITVAGWRSVFYICALCGAAATVLWLVGSSRVVKLVRPLGAADAGMSAVKSEAGSGGDKKRSPAALLLGGGLLPVAAAIVVQGLLRDGITTWTPSLIAETYNAENTVAIFSSVIIPLLGIAGVRISSAVRRRLIINEIRCGGVFFALGCLFCAALYFLRDSGMIVSAVLSGLTVGCMHGVNFMLIGILPARFANTGRVGVVSGLLNSLTYVGSALSSYGFARLSELYGWDFTLLSWLIFLAVGTVLCFAGAKTVKSR